MITRENKVTYKDKPITLVGDRQVHIGEQVPPVRLSKSMEEDLNLADLRGKAVLLNIIPSIDTPVCSSQTVRFNELAAEIGSDVVVVAVSMDLPFAIQRWCREKNIQNIVTTSDYKYHELGKNFSLLMRGLGLLARSVLVIDRDGVLRYEEIVARMEDEPAYDPAIAALREAMGGVHSY